MPNEVKTKLSVDAQEAVNNIKKVQEGYSKVNQSIKQTDRSVDDLNRELLEQNKVIRSIIVEEKKLAAAASKGGKEQRDALKRVRGDLKVSLKEQRKITEEIKRTVREQNKSAKAAKGGSAIFKKLGSVIAGAFAVTALIRFGKESLKLYNLQAQAEQRLLVALKGRKDVQESLLRQAKRFQGVTIFGDEEVIAAQSLIAAFTKEEDQIKELTRVTLDFATAKGFDLKSAAELVSKTFASSTNSLTRYGIQVEGAAGSSERLTDIITNLDNAFQGQAEAAGDAGAAALIKFQNRVNDLKEQIGKALTPEVIKLIDILYILNNSENTIVNVTFKANETIAEMADKIRESKDAAEDLAEQLGKTDYADFMQGLIDSFMGIDPLLRNIMDYTGATEEQSNTIGGLQQQLKELKEGLLEKDVADQRGIHTQLVAIDALQERLKALTSLNDETEKAIDLEEKYGNIGSQNIETISIQGETIEEKVAGLLLKVQELQKESQELQTINIKGFHEGILESAKGTTEKIIELTNHEATARINAYADMFFGVTDVLRSLAGANEKYANFIKVISELEIIANGAVAIALALKNSQSSPDNALTGGISGLVKFATISGVILSTIAASISNLKAAPVPTFAEGTPMVRGAGTETSDSILAMLSKGERVVPAKQNRENWDALESIREGKFNKEYFDKDTVIKIAQKYEIAEKQNFADNIAASLDFMRGLDSHDDFMNVRGKLGDSNYYLKDIRNSLRQRTKYERR